MKTLAALVSIVIIALAAASAFAGGNNSTVMRQMESMPLAFTQNNGQWPDSILFRASASGAMMWFTNAAVYYQFTRHASPGDERSGRAECRLPVESDRRNGEDRHPITTMIKALLVGANPHPQVIGQRKMAYVSNYFLGNDPAQWRVDVANYREIALNEVYPGINLVYYGNDGHMEYDFRVAAGADYGQIRIQYEGAESLEIGANRTLIIQAAGGEIRELTPVVYQERNDEKRIIEAEYVIEEGNAFRFRLGSEYDPSLPVVIDPVLSFSTFLGGAYEDLGIGVAVDASGCAYVVGHTQSLDFPTQNAYDASLNTMYGHDAFVTKFAADGQTLVYSTYLGGTEDEKGYAIAVDTADCAYVTGLTYSVDLPIVNAFDNSYNYGNNDGFVAKLSATGNALVYCTYLGTNGAEVGLGIAVDRSGCAYITGYNSSSGFPTLNAYDDDFNGSLDGFVTKLSDDGNALVYSTYLGGTDSDAFADIVTDSLGCAYVIGQVTSTDLPTQNAFDAGYNGGVTDVYVAKLSAAGDALVYATYLGGAEADGTGGIALDDAGCAYVTGYTGSDNFPVRNAYDSTINSSVAEVAFITKFSAAGNDLVYSTYLGGSTYNGGNNIAVDRLGYAYIIGETNSADFPTKNAYDSIYEGSPYLDVFMAKLTPSGTGLVYSTLLGGIGDDRGIGLAIDDGGCAYGTGETKSSDFPTQNAYDAEYGDFTDAFVVKLCGGPVYLCGDANRDETINVGDAVYIINYVFKSGDVPEPLDAGDANCDGTINVGDAVHIINYVFKGGDAPCCP